MFDGNTLITEIMLDPTRGASAFEMARTFANSQLVPRHLQGKVEDCFIALTMAAALRQNPLMVMQNIVMVQGTAGWKAAYVIAMANSSGLLKDRIDWKIERTGGRTAYKRKTKEGMVDASMENMRVTAFATLAGNGARVEFSVDTTMAIGDGWASNEKYTTTPEVMLRYRAGAFLVRFYAPDVMLGMYTDVELETMPAEVRVEPRERPATLRSPAARAIADAGRANAEIPAQPAREVIEATATQAEESPTQASADERPAGMRDIQRALDAGRGLGLDQAHLEAHVSRPLTAWTVADLHMLSELIRETRRGKSAATATDDEGV